MLAEKWIGFRLKHLLKLIFSFFAFFFPPEEGVEMQNSIVQFSGGGGGGVVVFISGFRAYAQQRAFCLFLFPNKKVEKNWGETGKEQ